MLFGVLYVLLLQEQTALVIGSMMLFAVIAGVMVVTRRINWYGVIDQHRASGG
jgi:inner membrane protein